MELILGDCLEVMKSVDKVDMILCDLPYGKTKNKWDKIIPFDQLWAHYERICPSGNIVLFGQDKFTGLLMQHKWHRYNLIWDKVLLSGFLNANRQPLRQHEDVCIFYKSKTTYNPQKTPGAKNHSKGRMTKNTNANYGDFIMKENNFDGLKFPTSILKFPKPAKAKSKHPNEKPVDLLEYLIKTYSNEGDVVIDNCIGSGGTGVACLNTGRRFIGIDNDEVSFNSAKARLNV